MVVRCSHRFVVYYLWRSWPIKVSFGVEWIGHKLNKEQLTSPKNLVLRQGKMKGLIEQGHVPTSNQSSVDKIQLI